MSAINSGKTTLARYFPGNNYFPFLRVQQMQNPLRINMVTAKEGNFKITLSIAIMK